MMTQHRGGSFARAVPPIRPLPLAVGLSVLLLGGAWIPAASAHPVAGWSPDSLSWSNGVVLCEFVSDVPGVNASASDLSESGLSVGLSGMAEVNPSGATVASVNLTGAAWQVSNQSNDDDYILAFATTAPVESGPSGPSSPGAVNVSIDFILPAYAEDSGTALNVVTAQLTISNWTWQVPDSSLEVRYAAGPAYAGTEHLATPPQPGWLFASVSNRTGQPLEWMEPGANATIWAPSGAPQNVSVTSSIAIHSAASGTVSVDLLGAGVTYQSSKLQFDSEIGIVLPTKVAGIPLSDFIAVASIGILASLAIAGVARRVRRRPSRLIYVDEEET